MGIRQSTTGVLTVDVHTCVVCKIERFADPQSGEEFLCTPCSLLPASCRDERKDLFAETSPLVASA